jgi:hypothetical protein
VIDFVVEDKYVLVLCHHSDDTYGNRHLVRMKTKAKDNAGGPTPEELKTLGTHEKGRGAKPDGAWRLRNRDKQKRAARRFYDLPDNEKGRRPSQAEIVAGRRFTSSK